MVEFEKQYQDIVKKSKSKKTVTLSLSDSVESE
jgi:hypothetical protein